MVSRDGKRRYVGELEDGEDKEAASSLAPSVVVRFIYQVQSL